MSKELQRTARKHLDSILSGLWTDVYGTGEELEMVLKAYLDQCKQIEEYKEILNTLASWGEGEIVGPHFDCPWAAELAREVLTKFRS